MAPMNPDDARAEQLRLAKELQRDFQKSGTFNANSSGQGQGRPHSRHPKPNKQSASNSKVARHPPSSSRQQFHHFGAHQSLSPNIGRSFDNRKRKMDSQTADFFADRPNTAQERGSVHYYQGEDCTAAPTNTPTAKPAFAASSMAMGTTQGTAGFAAPAMTTNAAQTAGLGQADAGSQSKPVSFPTQTPMPSGPILWLYQDNNEQPQPLPRDENMMDMDMPDASTAGALSERASSQLVVCSCTRVAPPAGPRGLGASRWAANNMKIDDNCPYHGTHPVPPFKRNNNGKTGSDHDATSTQSSGYAHSAAENQPKRFIGYYQ